MFRRLFRFLFKVLLGFLILSIGSVLVFKFVPVPITPLMIFRSAEMLIEGKSVRMEHDWISLEKISPNLQKAVIVSEDGHFLTHNGFDLTAIKKAYENNQKGKRIKGGSTISQQTAKNVFLWQGRSYVRKGLEAYFTVLIELLWSKERIMEVYLNSIEMGDGIYGAQAASQFWYHKDASNLTVNEAAGIAAILPSPRRYNPVKSGPYVSKRKSVIGRYIRSYGPLSY